MEQTMANPAISIIVPVYNSAPYLKRALDSIRRQSMKHYEVILINDGSTDSSRDILLSYCRKDARFRLIDQENSGVSAARNAGLKAARGEYIAFLDSDDFLAPFYLQRLYRAAVEFDADIVCCGFYRYYEEDDRVVPTTIRRIPAGVYASRAILKKMILDLRVRFYLWDKLWRRSLFAQHGITFPNMCFEDAAVAVPLLYFSNKVAVVPYRGYYYTQRKGSMIASRSVQNMDDYIKSLAVMRNFLELQGDYGHFRRQMSLHGLTIMASNWFDLTTAHSRNKDYAGLIRNIRASNTAIQYYLGRYFTPNPSKEPVPNVLLPVRKQGKKEGRK